MSWQHHFLPLGRINRVRIAKGGLRDRAKGVAGGLCETDLGYLDIVDFLMKEKAG